MTRIEVFSDAAFAFAVTMLVISLSTIPKNYQELILAMKGIPSFAASFAVMMVVWVAHRRWSQRFGLDDGISNMLTLALVFIVLIFVYPLKLIMDLTFYAFSRSWFPSEFAVASTTEVAGLVAFYSMGLCLVASILLGLYSRAESKADEICLSELEGLIVRKEQQTWLVLAIAGLISTIVALVFMNSLGYLAGITFGLVPAAFFFVTRNTGKKIKELMRDLESKPEHPPAQEESDEGTS